MTSTESTSRSSIAEQAAAVHAGLAAEAPADVVDAFSREQAELDAAGMPEGVLGAGDTMPDGALLDTHGEQTTLGAARAGATTVVVFYRGAWCPYCNLTLATYQQQLVPELSDRGVGLVAVSPQSPDGSLTTAENNELSFTVLCDPGNQIASGLGILTHPDDDARAAQAAMGIDVAGGNADGTDNAPMPTTVVVDPDGSIRWIDVHPNYATRSEPGDILAAVDAQSR